MKKTFCDRCGTEINDSTTAAYIRQNEDVFYVTKKFEVPDLCNECMDKLQEFLKPVVKL